MSITTRSLHSRLALFALVALALLASAGSMVAQASLSLSGGSGTPFVLTLNGPVSYTINAAPTLNAPFFIFKSVGNVLGGQANVAGTITFSVNGGASQSLANETSGNSVGSIGPTDLYIFGQSAIFTIGDVVTLNAGTLSTTGNVANAAPPGGSFTTFITDGNGVKISTNGVPVPEPSTWAMLLVGLGLLCYVRRSRSVAER